MDGARAEEILELAEAVDAHLGGPDQLAWERKLSAVVPELAGAVDTFLAAGNWDGALRVAAAVGGLWATFGRVDEGRDLTTRALASGGGDARFRARVLEIAGRLAFRQGDQRAAAVLTDEAIDVANGVGDRRTVALAFINRARIAFRDGNATEMERLAQRALDSAADDGFVEMRAVHMLAWAAEIAGDRERAIRMFHDSVELGRRREDSQWEAMELANIGDLRVASGDLSTGAEYLGRALRVVAATDDRYLLCSFLRSLGLLSARRGECETALRLLGAAEAQYEAASLLPDPGGVDDEALVDQCRDALGSEGADTAWAAGRALTLPKAIAEAEQAAG